MKTILKIALAQFLPLAAQLGLACEAPGEFTAPDGRSATEQEMAVAGRAFHQFMIDNQLYQVCLEDEVRQARRQSAEDGDEQIRVMEEGYSASHNAATAAMKAAAEAFEQAIAAFDARQ